MLKNNYKVYVKDEETSARLQNHAFSLGIKWNGIESIIREKDKPFLYFEKEYITKSNKDSFEFFKKNNCIELSPEEFLGLTEENENNNYRLSSIRLLNDSEILSRVWKAKEGDLFFTIIGYDKESSRENLSAFLLSRYGGADWISREELFRDYVGILPDKTLVDIAKDFELNGEKE